jgi:transcriptional regulator with XRE-family HTH domain
MATILELADFAGVSAENVLRVVHGEPVSEDVSARVLAAIYTLGPPPYAQPSSEVLPAETEKSAALERKREELLERFAAAAAELEAGLPQGVGSVVYEALRIEVRPVAQSVAELGSLFEQMIRRLEQVGGDLAVERRERVEDIALIAELITTGWRTVDRRLGRLEQMISRLEERQSGKPSARVIRLDERNRSQQGE